MEFANVGQHCSDPLCRQKDFLPFKCDACSKIFCLEHRSYTAHQCPNAGARDRFAIECPICAKTIHFTQGANLDAEFDLHQQRDCDPETRKARVHVQRCPVAGCKEKLTASNRATCPKCGMVTCLAHRWDSDHKCPGKRPAPARGGLLGRITGAAAAPPAPAPAPAASASASTARPSAKPAAASSTAAAAAARVDNSVRGTAARRQRPAEVTVAALPPAQPTGSARGGGDELQACPECGFRCSDPAQLVQHFESHAAGSGTAAHHAFPQPVPAGAGDKGSCIIT